MTAKKPRIKLVCFDLDNTLVDFSPHNSAWDFLHDKLGVFEKSQKIKKDFFEGKINYDDWVRLDSGLWVEKKPLRKDLERHLRKAKPMKNASNVLKKLKKKGLKLALISGSVDFILETFFPKGLFDYVVIERSYFSRKGHLERIDAFCKHEKLAHVKSIAKAEGLSLKEVAFVGDGFNDVEAVREVGLGIAFNSSVRKLEKAAKVVIMGKDFSKVLEAIEKHA